MFLTYCDTKINTCISFLVSLSLFRSLSFSFRNFRSCFDRYKKVSGERIFGCSHVTLIGRILLFLKKINKKEIRSLKLNKEIKF